MCRRLDDEQPARTYGTTVILIAAFVGDGKGVAIGGDRGAIRKIGKAAADGRTGFVVDDSENGADPQWSRHPRTFDRSDKSVTSKL
jgi:hypothetical protein